MTFTLVTGDAIEEMDRLPAGSVDAVICDPPYGTTQNAWDAVIPFPAMWRSIWRATKPDAAVVLMAAQPFATDLIASGREWFRYDLVWRKNKPRGFLNAAKQPLRSHELILVFYRKQPFFCPQKSVGHRPGNTARQTSQTSNYGKQNAQPLYGGSTERHPVSVLDFAVVNNDTPDRVHPTQKPTDLMAWLIRSYTRPGETVLDFACGSGATGLAALTEGRCFIGIEKDPGYADAARTRALLL